MAKFKTKAEASFEEKMKIAVDARDWAQVTHLFHLLGCYFELIEPIQNPEMESPEKEAEEHTTSKGFAEWCINTLHRDPVTMIALTPEQLVEHGVTPD